MTEFVSASALRALAYVQAASVAKARLTATNLDDFNRERAPEWASIFARVAFGTLEAPNRSMAGYLKRVGWVIEDDRRILAITDLGAAVLSAHDDVAPVVDAFELVIRSEVPLDYAALYREVSRTTDAMIVDAYFAASALEYVGAIEEVKRVLILETGTHADGEWAKRQLDFSRVLTLGKSHVEVRYVPKSVGGLHDRFVLPAHGSGLMLGGSFGGQKPNTVVTLSAETTAQHRDYYNKVWKDAAPLTPAAPGASEGSDPQD